MIGLSLIPVAISWAMGNDDTAPDYGSMGTIGFAVPTLLIILVISRVFQGAISRLSILIGLVIGTLVAVLVGAADFSAWVTRRSSPPSPCCFSGHPRSSSVPSSR